jgi:iron complex outermembrane receptor protein
MRFLSQILIIASVLLLPALSFGQSQNYELRGKVYDSNSEESLSGATVAIKKLNKGAATDANGAFIIQSIPAGEYEIRVSYVGYQSIDTTLDIEKDMVLDFALEPSVFVLKDLLITAGRDSLMESTRSINVIEKAELVSSRGQTIGESLQNVPGVTLLKTGPSIAKPVIRGLHSQRILTLNHGIAQEGQQWGGEHAPEIDPFAADRIEIIKGAAGVEYGIGAIGGVIRVDEESINKKGVHGEAYLNTFTNNLQAAGSLKLSGGADGIDGLGWRAQGSLRRAGDSRTPRDVIGNSGFKESDYSAGLNYEHGRFEHDLYYSHFGTELGIYRGSHIGNFTDLMRAIERSRPLVDYDFSYEIRAPKQKISHDLIRYKMNYQVPEFGQFELQYGFQDNHRQEFDAHKRFNDDPDALKKPAFDLSLFTHTADLKFRHQPVGKFSGSIGLSGIGQTNVRKGSGFLIPNFRAYGGGVFLIENWSNDVLTLEAGARYDYQWRRVFAVESKGIERGDYTFNSLTFVTGFSYQFADTWSLSSNLGTAWRPPGVNEQFSNGVHHGTAQFERGDAGLSSEKSYNIDVTLRKVSSRFYGQLSTYYNHIDNYIFLRPESEPVVTIRGSFPFFSYESTDALLRGIDGSAEYQLTNTFRLGALVSIVRGNNRNADEPLIFMPADRFKLSGRYSVPEVGSFQNNFMEAGLSLVREQHRFPANLDYAPPPDGYGLIDIEAGTTIPIGSQKLILSGAVKNALNTVYRDYLSRFRYFIDDTGRNFILKAQLQF